MTAKSSSFAETAPTPSPDTPFMANSKLLPRHRIKKSASKVQIFLIYENDSEDFYNFTPNFLEVRPFLEIVSWSPPTFVHFLKFYSGSLSHLRPFPEILFWIFFKKINLFLYISKFCSNFARKIDLLGVLAHLPSLSSPLYSTI